MGTSDLPQIKTFLNFEKELPARLLRVPIKELNECCQLIDDNQLIDAWDKLANEVEKTSEQETDKRPSRIWAHLAEAANKMNDDTRMEQAYARDVSERYPKLTYDYDKVKAPFYKGVHQGLWFATIGISRINLFIAVFFMAYASLLPIHERMMAHAPVLFDVLVWLNSQQHVVQFFLFPLFMLISTGATIWLFWRPRLVWESYRSAGELLINKGHRYISSIDLFSDDEKVHDQGRSDAEKFAKWLDYIEKHAGRIDHIGLTTGEVQPTRLQKVWSFISYPIQLIFIFFWGVISKPIRWIFSIVKWILRFKPKRDNRAPNPNYRGESPPSILAEIAGDRLKGQKKFFAKRHAENARLFLGIQILVIVVFVLGSIGEFVFAGNFAISAIGMIVVLILMEYRDMTRCEKLMYQYRKAHEELVKIERRFEKGGPVSNTSADQQRVEQFVLDIEHVINKDLDRWAVG